MHKTLLIILMVCTVIFGITACDKEPTVLDYPNVLLKVDLTPGEEENQIAVFLYTTRTLMDYEVKEKNEHFKILELNNTVKTMKATELPIDGIENLVENVRLIQVVQENNKENPLVARIIFKILNPDVKLKIISQIQKIDPSEVQKQIDQSDAAKVIAETMKPKTSKVNIIIVIAFWLITLIGIAIYVISVKLKNKKAHPPINYVDIAEENIEYPEKDNNTKITEDSKDTENIKDKEE